MFDFFRRRGRREPEPTPEPEQVEEQPESEGRAEEPDDATATLEPVDEEAAEAVDTLAAEDEEIVVAPDVDIFEGEAGPDQIEQPVEKPSFFQRFNPFRAALSRTRRGFFGNILALFRRRGNLDDDFWDELEELLITADVGAALSDEILLAVKKRVRDERISEPAGVQQVLEDELVEILGEETAPLAKVEPMTTVMVIGVNGVGKTTSIAKLSKLLKDQGERIMLAAADTFRAAAVDQLKVWAERVGVPVISHQEGADPGAVAFDALQAGRARRCSYVIIDTAGRLHTKHNLMEELRKVRRVVQKVDSEAPHEVLLVLDAVTGQNAILQAKTFSEAVGVTGIVVTKLDGTAKGGAVFAIRRELGAPIKFVATGEKLGDLAPFDARAFVRALFESDEDEAE